MKIKQSLNFEPDIFRPYAIIIGLDSFTGLQAARILADRNIPVIAIAKDRTHFCCRTKVCERIIEVDTEGEELISTLEALGPALKSKAVLFPCSDTSVMVISRQRDRLQNWYHYALPDTHVIEMMIDKVEFYRFAQKNQFPIPETELITSRVDAEKLSDRVSFPVIVKPPYRPDEWRKHTKEKAFKAANEHELLAIYDLCNGWADILIVQEWIEGPDTNHITCNCYFDSDSNPLVTFTSRKLRQWPQKTGEGCLGDAFFDKEVAYETIHLLKEVKYRGLGYLEMKKDESSGKYFIIEPNVGRPTGRSATAEANGVELLYTMYCDAIGDPLPENREQKNNLVKWIYLRRDVQSALLSWLHGELTLLDWWQSLRGPKWYALFSWTDPAPFWYDVWRVLKLLIQRKR